MTASKQKKFKLRIIPNLPQEMNKPLVIVIAAFLCFIVVFAIISAFNAGTSTSQRTTKEQRVEAKTDQGEMNSALKELPQNYQDVSGLEKYSSGAKNKEALASLKQELDRIRSQDETLQQELANLKRQPQAAPPPSIDPQDQQARASGMFFSSVPASGDAVGTLIGGGTSGAGSGPSTSMSGGGQSLIGGGSAAANQTIDPAVAQLPFSKQTNFYQKQGMEIQKAAVLKATDNPEDIYDLHNVVKPVSPFEIQAGTIIPAVLITAVNTSSVGTVVAQIKENMYDSVHGKFLLIPKGSKVLGEYEPRTAYGQERVLISFTRVIRPDGSSILLGKPTGADMQGEGGLEGKVDNHWGRVLGAATLSTLLSVGAAVASDSFSSSNTYYPGPRQNALLGAASGISQAGQSITNRALDIQPTITIPAGFEFDIIVRRDMVLAPFKNSDDSDLP